MQTFLPHADFAESARVLDRQRLGKQRVECLQIVRTLTGVSGGWVNHPAVKMWRGHEVALVEYGLAICDEWVARNYRDGCRDQMVELVKVVEGAPLPQWFGDDALHLSHRSNLVRKLPEHYGPLWPGVPNDLPYVWPVQ
jgi:hypothetical protein